MSYLFRLTLLVLLSVLGLQSIDSRELIAKSGTKSVRIRKPSSKKKSTAKTTRKPRKKSTTPRKPRVKKSTKKNYPPPGSGGEDRNIDWLRKRAFPNEYLDPSYYPNALEQARKLPVYGGYSKNGIQSAMQWQSIGPFAIGGRVTAIATHPTDSNTFYIGAASGGLWKTTDHGNLWQALTDTFASLPIGCVTLDPHDPNTIYIGMGECNYSGDSYPGNGLWRSIDAGLTWSFLGLGKTQYIAKIIVDPIDKNTIYACVPGPGDFTDSNRGVWKSTDYGITWNNTLLIRTNKSKTSTSVPAIDLVMNPLNRNELVASLWQHIDLSNSSSANTGLWLSTDAGGTWARIDTLPGSGLPNGFTSKRLSRIALAWAVNSKGVSTLFAVISKVDVNIVTKAPFDENLFGIFKTTTPESGWKILLDSNYRIPFGGLIYSSFVDSIDFFNKQGGYDNIIITNPSKPDDILVGGIDVIRSSDGGVTWKDISDAYVHYFENNRSQHSDQHALAFTAATSGTDLLNGQDGGVFNTKDFGATWPQLKGLPITMFYHLEPWAAGMANLPVNFPADSNKLFGGTQDNGTVAHGFSSNPDWDWINRGDGGEAQADPEISGHIITSLQLGKIFFRSTIDSLRPILQSDYANHDPNAKIWTDLSTIAVRRGITDSSEACAFIPPVVLDKIRGDEVFTGKTRVYRTKLSFTDPDSSTIIQPWSPQITGYAGQPKNWYYGDVECIGLGVRDQNGRPMIWAGGLLGGTETSLNRTVYNPAISQDTAPRWIKIISGLPTAIVETIACDRSDSLTAYCGLIGTSSTKHVYKTTNGGKNWISISGNLPNIGVNAIIIDSLAEQGNPGAKNQCLIVATDVGVFVTTDGGTTWSNLGMGMPHLVVGTINQYKNWLIAGTHGRSAWALDISGLQALPVNAVHEKQTASNRMSIRSIYPSPLDMNASSLVHIVTDGIADENVTIGMMNAATGASVFRTHSTLAQGKLDIQLPASVSSGSYLVRITRSDGESATGQIVIIK